MSELPPPNQQTRNRRAALHRDLGVQRITRHRRWLIGAAVGLSCLFSAVVALAKPGATHRPSSPAASPSQGSSPSSGAAPGTGSSSSSSSSSAGSSGDSSSSATDPNLQPPAQTPAPSQAPPVVSSGGS